MIHLKELQPLTGYIRGGCSPLGAKKDYPVYIDETALNWEKSLSVPVFAADKSLLNRRI